MSIDEEPVSLDQSSHDLPSDQQTSCDLPLDQQASLDKETSHDPSSDQQASHDLSPGQQQFPGSQTTQDQTSNDQELQSLSLDHQKSQDQQAIDSRSPSFMSLQNEGLTVQASKQRKEVVLEQPLMEEAIIEMKEDDESSSQVKEETDAPSEILHKEADVDKSKSPLGEVKEEDLSSDAKEETDAPSEFLRVPSSQQQQQRSLSVPSYPPQLKGILRRSNAPKSLSLDIHNMDDMEEGGNNKRPPLVHKMSVSYIEYCLEHVYRPEYYRYNLLRHTRWLQLLHCPLHGKVINHGWLSAQEHLIHYLLCHHHPQYLCPPPGNSLSSQRKLKKICKYNSNSNFWTVG